MTEKYEKRVSRAVELFMSGLNCSQSVVAAFSDLYGFSEEQAKIVSNGFGGGIGRMRSMCGAASGLVILAGMHTGQPTADAQKDKAQCYELVQQLLGKFKEENGSLICAELLGLKGPIPMGNFVPAERNAEYYKKRPCSAKVESAARIFADFLEKEELTSSKA